MTFQQVFFPLWMGAGVKTTVPNGCEALQTALNHDGTEIPVPKNAKLEKTDLIKAKPELLEAMSRLKTALQGKTRVALLGGDCSSDYALLAHSSQLYGQDLAVVWLDTHADLNTPTSSPSGHFHGMVLRANLGDSDLDFAALNPFPIAPKQVFLAGARDFDPPELEYIQSHNIHVSSVPELQTDPSNLAQAIAKAGYAKIHVHLDLDVLKSFASASFSNADGIELPYLLAIIYGLKKQFEIVSFAVTEYAPQSENADLKTVLTLIQALEENL